MFRQIGGSPEVYFKALDLPFRQFFYWDRTLGLADCRPSEKAFLVSHMPALFQGKLENALEHPVSIDLNLKGLATTDYQQLPYFQGFYRVLSPALLQQTQALRHPVLSPYLDPKAPEQLGLLHLGPIVIDQEQKRCWGVLRCNAELRVHAWDYILKPFFKLVSTKKACYTEQQEYN